MGKKELEKSTDVREHMLFAPEHQREIFCIAPGFLFICLLALFFNAIEKKEFEMCDGGVGSRVTNLSERPTLDAVRQNFKCLTLCQEAIFSSRAGGSWPKIGHSHVLPNAAISILP